jgi:transposase-like protein
MSGKEKGSAKGQHGARGTTSAATPDGVQASSGGETVELAPGGEVGASEVLGLGSVIEVRGKERKAKRAVAVPPKEPLPPMPEDLSAMLSSREPGKLYSDELKALILEHIFSGIGSRLTISDMCKQEGMPEPSAIYRWILADANARESYAAARKMRADSRADRIDEITDMVLRGAIDAQAARVAIDAERWQASKENQQYYGDRVQVDSENSPSAVLDALTGLVKAISGATRSLLPEDNPVIEIGQ